MLRYLSLGLLGVLMGGCYRSPHSLGLINRTDKEMDVRVRYDDDFVTGAYLWPGNTATHEGIINHPIPQSVDLIITQQNHEIIKKHMEVGPQIPKGFEGTVYFIFYDDIKIKIEAIRYSEARNP